MKTFGINLPTDADPVSIDNWKNMLTSTNNGSFNPIPASGGPTITGLSSVKGTYQILGGVCMFRIYILATSVVFAAGSYQTLLLPLKGDALVNQGPISIPVTQNGVALSQFPFLGWLTLLVNNSVTGLYWTNGASALSCPNGLATYGWYFI